MDQQPSSKLTNAEFPIKGMQQALRESAKQFRLNGDKGHADMCEAHVNEAFVAFDRIQELFADREHLFKALLQIQQYAYARELPICKKIAGMAWDAMVATGELQGVAP